MSGNHHHGHGESAGSLSFEEKLEKLLEHWKHHNEDHASTYYEWAEKAGVQQMPEISALLKEVADMTIAINTKFDNAAEILKKNI